MNDIKYFSNFICFYNQRKPKCKFVCTPCEHIGSNVPSGLVTIARMLELMKNSRILMLVRVSSPYRKYILLQCNKNLIRCGQELEKAYVLSESLINRIKSEVSLSLVKHHQGI
jgi:hypothetical protein